MPFTVETVARSFFNGPLVLKKLSREKRQAFSKAGAFVRQRARTSIRKRKQVSEPGSPPSSHAGHLRNLILFAWDQRTESVVVGPATFGAKRIGGGVVPGLMERGGSSPATGRRYRPRPFMAPALAAEQQKFPDLFRGILRG